jgi:hypothetical protein
VPLERLRARVLERWRVIELREGLVLVPRRARDGVRGVELTGDQLYVDGRPVSGAELRSLLGGDAETVLSLSFVDADTRSRLFGQESSRGRDAAAVEPPWDRTSSTVVVHNRGARVRIGGNLVVADGERVGDAVAILGSIDMNGEASGDVVAVGGNVRLGPKAIVRGEVTAVGGHVVAEPTARLLGGKSEFALVWPDRWELPLGPDWRISLNPDRRWWADAAFVVTSTRLLVAAVLGMLIALIGGSFYRRVNASISAAPAQSILLGLALAIVGVPAALLICLALLISVVGIPLLALVPLVVLLLALVWLVGFTAVAERVGCLVLGARAPTLAAFLIGFVLLTGTLWVARLAWWSGGIGAGAALSIGLVGATIEGAAWLAALGGVVLVWLNREGRVSAGAIVPPVPSAANHAEQI